MSKNEYIGWVLGCTGLILLFNGILGAWSINTILAVLFNASVPQWQAFVAGLFLGQFSIPLAVFVWVLRSAGVL